MTDYKEIKSDLEKLVKGEIFDDSETLKKYSRDASLFEVFPKLIIWPKDSEDIKNIVKFVSQKKQESGEGGDETSGLSITVRAAGSCMSGGSLNESIILDVSKYFNKFSVDAVNKVAEVEPGVFYRDFETETLKHGLILPCYTASKNLCALGGMIGNNAAGEKTLRWGNMENFVEELEVVLKDGELCTFKSIPMENLHHKSGQQTFEGEIYGKMARLIYENKNIIGEARPKTSKNSSGYYLWNIEKNGSFDLTKVLVGSQGTLGIVTKAKIKLEEIRPQSKLLVIFMDSTERLGEAVNVILSHKPESLESYDDATLKLAIRFLPEMIKLMKTNILKLLWNFLPEVWMSLTGQAPKLVLLAEFSGKDEDETNRYIQNLKEDLKKFNFKTHATKNIGQAEKYWTIRRESFNLLRKHVKNGRTVPFIDDICVDPKYLPEFLPKIRKILDDEKLVYTIAGHAGNGNFHIIPLMDMRDEGNRELIPLLSEKIFNLVKEYGGSNAAEHNDGIIRTPYLNKMYSPEILNLFSETKKIFDPQNIFNPGKKVNGTIEYMVSHISK